MDEQKLVNRFRVLYDQDKKAHAACVIKHGKRPEYKGNETPEQRKSVREAMEAWDYFFENDI